MGAKFAIDTNAIEAALSRHAKACLQISGGKDSLATLHVLRPYWNRITVAWLDTGDAPVETHEQMRRIAETVPSFLHMKSDQPSVIRDFGIPLDLTPPPHQPFGTGMHPASPRAQGRYQCCARVIWQPMADYMMAHGFTLWIRGQKNSDALQPNVKQGYDNVLSGVEIMFPINEWADADVVEYLAEIGATEPAYYRYGRSNIDCVTCPAYLTEFDRSAYVERHEPSKLETLRDRVAYAAASISENVAALVAEHNRIKTTIPGRLPLRQLEH
ncbi:MAG: phosphoadenosine phosphosulfate reductase family protein [Acidobacteria bacterium]|nr:phosphoadenosine phosphosulfate reductase family protein [Acidobacteriota bacterium]